MDASLSDLECGQFRGSGEREELDRELDYIRQVEPWYGHALLAALRLAEIPVKSGFHDQRTLCADILSRADAATVGRLVEVLREVDPPSGSAGASGETASSKREPWAATSLSDQRDGKFILEQETWLLDFAGKSARVGPLVGLRRIHFLLTHQGSNVDAMQVAGNGRVEDAVGSRSRRRPDGEPKSSAARAGEAVGQSIRTALERIGERGLSELRRHLEASIKHPSGSEPGYKPKESVSWTLE